MLRILVMAFLALVALRAQAVAQTAIQTQTSSSTARSPATPHIMSNTHQGTFEELSPGNQKIDQALCDAQRGGCPATAVPGQKTLTRDQIAALKRHRGWGEIFKEMKQNGQLPRDVKNLGQLVSDRNHSLVTSGSITITTASGRSVTVGPSRPHGTFRESFYHDDASGSGRSAAVSGSSGGGYGHGIGAESSASGSHGGGHGK